MAVADVSRVKIIAEGREGEWCITLHYQELTPPTLGLPTKQLAESFAEHITPTLRDCLSFQHEVSRVQVDNLSGVTVPNSTFSLVPASRVGTQLGKSLPAAAAMHIRLFQTLLPATSNGGFHVSGIPADEATGSVLKALFHTTQVAAFITQLLANVNEVSAGDGLWRIGVLSRKVLDAEPGNYEDAFAPVTVIGADTRLGRMRSRRFGGRRRTPAPIVV